MKVLAAALVAVLVCGVASVSAQEAGKKFGDAKFLKYEGTQQWPTGDRGQIISDFSVPIYLTLPGKPYKVLGRVYDDRTTGIGVMTRAFAEGLFSEKDRQRDVADQAKYQGGDAVLVTSDERVISSLGLSREELSKTTPLFQHRDSATLVIKFD